MKGPHSDPDVMLASDGRVWVNSASIPLADRAGRRVIRCVELTEGEAAELRRRVGELGADVLVGLTAKRGGVR